MNGAVRSVWPPTVALLLLSFGNLFGALRTGLFPHGFIIFRRFHYSFISPACWDLR
jgi:hypothetical protein